MHSQPEGREKRPAAKYSWPCLSCQLCSHPRALPGMTDSERKVLASDSDSAGMQQLNKERKHYEYS